MKWTELLLCDIKADFSSFFLMKFSVYFRLAIPDKLTTSLNVMHFFFLKIFGGHESFLWGHWYPCFGLLVMSPLGFKARVGSALFTLGRGIWVTLHIPWDSPLVLYLLTSWQPAWLPSWSLPHTCKGISGSRTGDLSLHVNWLSYTGSAKRNALLKFAILMQSISRTGHSGFLPSGCRLWFWLWTHT